ncbi:MAG: MCP four helix bundle domain-containing protein [Chryseosolibacter sp.]
MQWAHRIRRKISAALLLAAIFVLIFVRNMVENQYVHELGASFSSVYEDRLVVESYIYGLSDHLFRKKIMIDTCRSQQDAMTIRSMIDGHNHAIRNIIVEYEKTKLTDAEGAAFLEFKKNMEGMKEVERTVFLAFQRGQGVSQAKDQIDRYFNDASKNLKDLSAIQISEGKILNEHSKKIIAGSSLLTQFEMGILIAIGLMIMVLVFESTSVFTRGVGQGKESLN